MNVSSTMSSVKYAIDLLKEVEVRIAKSMLPGPKLPVPTFEFRYSDEYGNEIAASWGDSTPDPLSESPENARGPLPSGTSAPAASSQPATLMPLDPCIQSSVHAIPGQKPLHSGNINPCINATPTHSHPIASLRIAKGWEDKLAALGVTTIAELEQFIAAGKLVPGFAPRIGPDAVEKIKAALAKAGGVIAEADAKPPAPAIAPPQKTPEQIWAEGAEFARLGYKSSENPYTRGTSDWHAWDQGWQDWFATHDADDEATREDVPVATESTPEVPAEDFPEMDLAATATATATPQTELLDTSDL